MKKNRSYSLIVLFISYFVSILLGYFIYEMCIDHYSTLVSVLIADIAATLVIFVLSLIFNNSSMYDPFWSIVPPLLIVLFIMSEGSEGNRARQYLVLGLVAFWAIRLTYNFLKGWPGLVHEDWRYVDFRKNNPKAYWLISFSGIHLFPTLIVFAGCLSAYIAVVRDTPLNFLDIIAAVITFSAVILELVSDEQMNRYKKEGNTGPDAIMNRGLWKYSRHPNYLGEVMFWCGLFVFSFAADPSAWWTAVGPILMIWLFVFISIPMMDKKMLKKRPKFKAHMDTTSALLILPNKKLKR